MEYQNKEFTNKEFIDVDFSGSDFSGSVFINCSFLNCNLSNVKLEETRFQNILFKNCKIMGVNFSELNRLIIEMRFRSCLIEMCIFYDVDLKKSPLTNCQIFDGIN